MPHILLAEDDESMRHFLEMALVKAGYEITSCSEGSEALRVLQEKGQKIDLLLTDIVMPGIDGIELSQKAVGLVPGIKVMFITGFAGVAMSQRNGGDSSENQNISPARVLSKPFHLNDLVRQVEELLVSADKIEVQP